MSNTQTTQSSFSQAFLKDAGSYVIPVLIVLAAIFISMGNLFSATAVGTPEPTVTITEPSPVIVTGQTGMTVSGSAGFNLD